MVGGPVWKHDQMKTETNWFKVPELECSFSFSKHVQFLLVKAHVRINHHLLLVFQLPSGSLLHSHGKSPFLIGKPSISMGHLYHGYVSHNQRVESPGWLPQTRRKVTQRWKVRRRPSVRWWMSFRINGEYPIEIAIFIGKIQGKWWEHDD